RGRRQIFPIAGKPVATNPSASHQRRFRGVLLPVRAVVLAETVSVRAQKYLAKKGLEVQGNPTRRANSRNRGSGRTGSKGGNRFMSPKNPKCSSNALCSISIARSFSPKPK